MGTSLITAIASSLNLNPDNIDLDNICTDRNLAKIAISTSCLSHIN